MSKLKIASISMVCLVLLLASCQTSEVPIANIDCNSITYSNTIAPLFTSSCNTSGCHHAGSNDGDFTSYAKLKPYIDNGSIRKEVITQQTMPIAGPLSSNQLAQVQCWLDGGGRDN